MEGQEHYLELLKRKFCYAVYCISYVLYVVIMKMAIILVVICSSTQLQNTAKS